MADRADSPSPAPDDTPAQPFLIVGAGASAGGLEAYTELLETLPADPGLALLVVSHLDPTHKSHLPEILGRVSQMPVHEVVEGMRVFDAAGKEVGKGRAAVADGLRRLQAAGYDVAG